MTLQATQFHMVESIGLHFCMTCYLVLVARIHLFLGSTSGFKLAVVAPMVSLRPHVLEALSRNFRVFCLFLEMVPFLVKG